jgi:hypothetical protein
MRTKLYASTWDGVTKPLNLPIPMKRNKNKTRIRRRDRMKKIKNKAQKKTIKNPKYKQHQ